MREGSPPSKASSTLCHRNGFTKSLESFAQGVRFDRRPSFLDLPAKGNPLPKVRVLGSCRKSVAEKKRASSPADRPLRDAALWSPRCRIATKMPRLFLPPALPDVEASSGGQVARPHPTHRISVGRDGAAAPGNDLYVTMQPAD